MADDGGGVGEVGGMMSEKSGIVRTVGQGMMRFVCLVLWEELNEGI